MPGRLQCLKGGKYPYTCNQDLTCLSIHIRSIYLALPHFELSEKEVRATFYHDGQYVADNAPVSRKEKPLTLLLQYADTWSGFVLEKEERAVKVF